MKKTKKTNVLVVGGGGREHAIVLALAKSQNIGKIYCNVINAGIAELADCREIASDDFSGLLNLVRTESIGLTVVGPEDPLSKGIVDAFEKDGRKIVGPSWVAAGLESSKLFAKRFMERHSIPTANYQYFTSYKIAEDYVRRVGAPIVIKACGLAAGKGVFVATTIEEAIAALWMIMKDKAFGEAGDIVLAEQCLKGEEASFMVFTDGETIVPMVSSQDHKRVFDGDLGPNTGGMGAYSPAPIVTLELEKEIMENIMRPAIKGMKAEGIKYKGFLYAGLMIDGGKATVLEFNCRLGDPETQPVLSRLNTDFLEICLAIADEKLDGINVQWKPEASVCVVLASKGYPGKYEKGKIITGLKDVAQMKNVTVFHAGTTLNGGIVVTNGGRVLGVTATGPDIRTAKELAYEAVDKINFEGMQYRKDIADRAIKR